MLEILYMSILRVNGDIIAVEGSGKVSERYVLFQNKVVVVEFVAR